MRIVNASPLILLARVGCLELLREPPDSDVSVPEVVFQEVLAGESFDPHVAAIRLAAGTGCASLLLRRTLTALTRIDLMTESLRSFHWPSTILEPSSCSTTGLPARKPFGVTFRCSGRRVSYSGQRNRVASQPFDPRLDAVRQAGLYLTDRLYRTLLRLAGE